YYSPWGFGYYGSNWAFALTFNLDYGYWAPWYWGAYTASWLPLWYTVFRPYVPYYETSVVYETIVVESEPAPAEVVIAEPAPAAAPAAPAQRPGESAAAERYVTLGDQAFRDGRYTDAVQLYAKAIEFSPDEGALYLVLADALFAAGDYHYGAYAIRRALELDHGLANTDVDKHEFYPDPRQFDHQLAVLEQYLLDHPEDRDARLVLALNDLFGRRPAAAVDLLEAPEASSLAEDPAALLVLDAARARQYGK
ncbi:MAG TPA: tetratricopeptide repeat protein, partial [Planctomycetes bacterium]|nr:tetratricopeptide repeat protein [Planctomycetota bacterium]